MELDYLELLKKAKEKDRGEIVKIKRFEIPQVVVIHQRKKTILKNFAEIVEYLRRDKRHVSRFLSKELAAPSYIEGNFLVFQANLSTTSIQKKIEKYIKEFVLCKVCGQPDTRLIKEKRINFIKCDACGARYPIEKI